MRFTAFLIFILFGSAGIAQPVTGTWRGKVQKGLQVYKVEVKFVRQTDSITGTSYYYNNPNNYQRYRIEGYLDVQDGSVHWWDSELLEEKGRLLSLPGAKPPFAASASLNCPGGGTMYFDGEEEEHGMKVGLTRVDEPMFQDGWDEIIAEWHTGGNNADLIAQARTQPVITRPVPPRYNEETAGIKKSEEKKEEEKPAVAVERRQMPPQPRQQPSRPATVRENNSTIAQVKTQPPLPKMTNEEKLQTRTKQVQTTLPLVGDSIEIHFYDNAEIDGDSIALFMNGRMLFEHVKLSAEPFVLRLAVADVPAEAELSMVAENLGSIPPNTSFMLAYVNGERYTARLESTEHTTAIIKLARPAP